MTSDLDPGASADQYSLAVVDDDDRVLDALTNLFESAGYIVHAFGSAEELLLSGCLTSIDCLISDIGLPGIDGLELQRLVPQRYPKLPIILVTGRHELTTDQLAAHGGQVVFQKPVNGQDLLNAIEAAVRQRH